MTKVDDTFKVLMIGDAGTGKSSLLLRFTDDAWLQPDQGAVTIGVDFKVKSMVIGNKTCKLAIWDTAGQERFRTLTSSYYRGAQGVILIYDVTQRASFEHLSTWFHELETNSSNPRVVKMIVGNKIDMESMRQISPKEGEAFAEKMGALFIETSAKTRAGVEDAFVEVARKIIETPELYQKKFGGLRGRRNSVRINHQDYDYDEGKTCC
ncbi:ras family-domain-containing protein [Chytriomyces cf. hyalinus JEL632]|nr:ras family-domain-containing protein [Chytriomyces cf. hyalinus JEL632]